MKQKAKKNVEDNESHIEIPGNRAKLLLRQTGDKDMTTMKKTIILISLIAMGATGPLQAKGAGTVGGLTLLEPTGARPASMGEAYTAATNDITAFGYNPASLKTLETGQAAFMYQKGMAEDAYGQFQIGAPMRAGSLGLSVGYYNAGTFDLVDENLQSRSVNAQTDLTVALGYARQMGPVSVGITGKYLQSKLIEQYKANAFAGDLGVQAGLGSRLSIGAAMLNMGTKLKFIDEGDSLPLIYRAGASYLLIPGSYATTLMVDMPYHAVEGELRPAAGLEVKVGPLAVRGGYRKSTGLGSEFTVGAGFLMGGHSLDYSFGMVDQLSAEHRISYGMRFGGMGVANTPIVRKPESYEVATSQVREERAVKKAVKPEVTFVQRQSLSTMDKRSAGYETKNRQVYIVRPGDTLGKIAKRAYGDAREWKKIYVANRHLLDDSKSLEVGQKIILP